MKTALATMVAVLALGGGDERAGYEALRAGQYDAAMKAFSAVIAERGPSPELCYNLALAAWKAGKPDEAEKAAEQVATLSDGKLAHLRDGILGALRYEKAKAEADPGKALPLAEQARDAFERGAMQTGSGPEFARNLERALALVAELEKKKKEQEEKKKDDPKKDDSKKDDQKQPDSRPQSSPQSAPESREQKPDQKPESRPDSNPNQDQSRQTKPEDGEPKSDEPQKADPKDGKQPEPKPGQDQGEAKDAKAGDPSKDKKPSMVPGEQKGGELTPEQTKRLLDTMQTMLEEKAKLRAQMHLTRPKVERDW